MTLTSRDRKLLAILVPALILVAYWFLLLGPKREQAAELSDQLVRVEQKADLGTAVVDPSSAGGGDVTVRRLAVALPGSPDVSALLLKLNRVATATGVQLERVTSTAEGGAPAPVGDVVVSEARPTPQATGEAGTAVANALTAGAGAEDGAAAELGTLEPVTLELSLVGSFPSIATMLDRLSNAVTVRGQGLRIKGRLMAIESVALTRNDSSAGVAATVGITAYYLPAEGGGSVAPDGTKAAPPSTLAAKSAKTGSPSSGGGGTPSSGAASSAGGDAGTDGGSNRPPLPRPAGPTSGPPASSPPSWVPPSPPKPPSGGGPPVAGGAAGPIPTGNASSSSQSPDAREEGR